MLLFFYLLNCTCYAISIKTRVRLMQRQAAGQTTAEGQNHQHGDQSVPGQAAGKAECTASLALTMLLMLKRYLKATYNMSEERIATFSPDLPDKRKQVGCPCLLFRLPPSSVAAAPNLKQFHLNMHHHGQLMLQHY